MLEPGAASRAGIKDVARVAGVSIATVSNFINWPERVSERTRLRIQDAVDELGYVRSDSARQLRAGRSRLVGLMVLDMGNPFFVELARGAEREIRRSGLGMMACDSGQDLATEGEYLSLFAQHRTLGVIVSAADSSGQNLDILRRSRIPFVRVDGTGRQSEACSVVVDDVAGGRAAMRHLVEFGHRNLVFVSGPSHLKQIQDRRTGVLLAMDESGLGRQALREIPVERPDVSAGRDAAARVLGLPNRPTAVFCANDLLALGMLQALLFAGVDVPGEIALVGYDDIEFARAAAIPLSSVRQPAEVMGARAAELLLREIDDDPDVHEHHHLALRPEMVVRHSSMRPM
jgi:LacI family transcriptional regulator